MADYRTEEEQIELLKKWWHENGRATLAGVAIALLLFFGWTQWQAYQRHKTEAAADIFQQLMTASESVNGAKKVTELAEQLRREYPDTVYGIFAGLRLAKDAVAANNLPAAAQFLEWVQQQGADATLQPLINLRAAQVQYAQNELDKALATLDKIKGDNAVWQGAVAELRGDVQAAQGKNDAARTSYKDAMQAFDKSGNQERSAALEVKISSLPAASPDNAKAQTGEKP